MRDTYNGNAHRERSRWLVSSTDMVVATYSGEGAFFTDEMRVSNSPMGCPTDISPVLIPLSPKTWLDWALEHQAAKAAAGRRSAGKRSDIVQPGQLTIWNNLNEE